MAEYEKKGKGYLHESRANRTSMRTYPRIELEMFIPYLPGKLLRRL